MSSSIYEWIKEHIKDGILPESCEFPSNENQQENELKFAPGARDGIAMYHMAAGTPSIGAFEEILSLINNKKTKEAQGKLSDFSKENTALSMADTIQSYIIEQRENLDGSAIFQFAYDLVQESSEQELVKYGLCILELFQYRDDSYDEMLRTLALSDEFTLFVVFIMRGWENAEEEILNAAKKVTGWGRIFAIDYLEPKQQKTKDWLLTEGIHNSVLPQYSALNCYEGSGLFARLDGTMTEEEFHGAGEILEALIEEGPMAGISAIEEADTMILKFLAQAKKHTLEIADYEVISSLLDYYEREDKKEESEENERVREIKGVCRKLLESTECIEYVNAEVAKGKGFALAKKLGLPYKEAVMHSIEQDFENNYFNISFLLPEGHYVDECIALFEQHLPLDTMKTGPAKLHGFGDQYKNYNILVSIVQFLKPYPGKGLKLIETALQSPVINNRHMALNVLEEWKKKGKNIKEDFPELMEIIARGLEREPDDKVRERMQQLLV